MTAFSRMKRVVLSSLLFAVVFALLGAEIVSYSRNTLENHPEWVNGKLLVALNVTGSTKGSRTRNLLQRNRLNLHEWHGFNEILFNDVFALGGCEFSFRLEEDANLCFLFNKTAKSVCAVRFSRDASRPSSFLRADSDGAFVEKRPLPELGLTPGWHRAELARQGAGLDVRVDGRLVQHLPTSPLGEQVIGFRAGRHAAMVDDVVVRNARGETIADENFRNDRNLWPVRFALFFGALGLVGLVLLVAWFAGRADRRFLLRLSFTGYLLVNALVLYFGFDFYYWSSRYAYKGFIPRSRGYRLRPIEGFRRGVFDFFQPFDARDREGEQISEAITLWHCYKDMRRFLKTAETSFSRGLHVIRAAAGAQQFVPLEYRHSAVREYLRQSPPASRCTILFLGSSQTWGAGADRVENSIVSRAHRALSAGTERPPVVFNGSLSGSHAAELLALWRTELEPLSPDLVVVNLSHNDAEVGFAEGLRGIVRLSEERGARLLFVLEPWSLEIESSRVDRNHDVMRKVAVEAGAPVLDLRAHTSRHEREDAGWLWWDRIHMTSYGQTLAGEHIAEAIQRHYGSLLSK